MSPNPNARPHRRTRLAAILATLGLGLAAGIAHAAPLPAVELAYNGHLESLGVLPLLLALRLWQRAGWELPQAGRRLLGAGWAAAIGALGGLAVLVKPVAGVLLPGALPELGHLARLRQAHRVRQGLRAQGPVVRMPPLLSHPSHPTQADLTFNCIS